MESGGDYEFYLSVMKKFDDTISELRNSQYVAEHDLTLAFELITDLTKRIRALEELNKINHDEIAQ